MKLHLVISAHGYGHIAQTGPIAEAWQRLYPDTRFSVCSAAPRAILDGQLRVPFEQTVAATDLGMSMGGALDVLADASHAAHLEFHADWDARLAGERRRLRRLAPDLLLSNVSYLSLAAAAAEGIPCAALCSLNWADIYAAYCGALPGAAGVLAQMREAYASADRFIVPTPGMWPDWLPRATRVGAIARRTTGDAAGLRRRLNLGDDQRLVTVNGGGLALRLPLERWTGFNRVHWLVPDEWRLSGPGISAYSASGMAFREMLLSCDAVLTKPGYGMFVDAACNGLPALYLERDDWPETPCLVAWLATQGRCVRLARDRAEAGDFALELDRLLRGPAPKPVAADGTGQAVQRLVDLLRIGG